MHDSELGHSQALHLFDISLLADDSEHKSKCILPNTLSTPLIRNVLFDIQVAHFIAENLLLNPFLFSHWQLSLVCLKRLDLLFTMVSLHLSLTGLD